ncbi:hypothetical protein C8R43DRAFT_1135400 [Mycena crocata]|nr:hypothetical protein C8R43DRAFT_1135400 [Mycena crocata]
MPVPGVLNSSSQIFLALTAAIHSSQFHGHLRGNAPLLERLIVDDISKRAVTTFTLQGAASGPQKNLAPMPTANIVDSTANAAVCRAPGHNHPPVQVLNSFTVLPHLPVTPSASSSRSPMPLAGRNELSSLPQPFTYERPMAKAIDPAYAQKILEGDHELATVNRFQTEQYRLDKRHQVVVWWWYQDNVEANTFVISVVTWPFLHPKDYESIRKFVGLANCLNYAYWDQGRWTTTQAAIEIKAGKPLMDPLPKDDCLILYVILQVPCVFTVKAAPRVTLQVLFDSMVKGMTIHFLVSYLDYAHTFPFTLTNNAFYSHAILFPSKT